MGSNLHYWDNGVSEYASVLIHFRPARGIAYLTITWSGINMVRYNQWLDADEYQPHPGAAVIRRSSNL